MTAQFTLAATVKLSRRLDALLRLDEKTEIDRSYISCAEYQLFIDQMRARREEHQPDHWPSDRFPPGDAKEPIAGVRASDAVAFCQWLTQEHATPGFRYRLPTEAEANAHPVVETQVGCWCHLGENFIVAGIDSKQWQIWQTQLVALLQSTIEDDRNRARTRARTRALDRTFDLDRTYARHLTGDLSSAFLRAFEHAHHLDHIHNFERIRASEGARDLVYDLNHASDLASDGTSQQRRKRNLKVLRANWWLIWRLWGWLADFHNWVSKNRSNLEILQLSRQDCNDIIRECSEKKKATFQIYTFFVLMDERRAGRMSAWEGIRIVRERVEG